MPANNLRKQILDLVRIYTTEAHQPKPFEPGVSPVPVSGRVYDEGDLSSLVDASLDFWLTEGRFNNAFEKKLVKFIGVQHALTVNSGSSANLLAIATLTSPQLGERALKAGDEVISVACCFPTTVNPLLFYNLIPVFVDVDIPTYNIQADQIENAITKKTKAIFIAHTLGNPFDLKQVSEIARKHNLWLIEDCCDALGSIYDGKKVGTYGDIGTLSFYPAHHITMGEGGAIFTKDAKLKKIIESFRDWGRDCWCDPGKDNTCGKRFDWKLGELPRGYDHKYIYSHAGFNFKITDMQAAVGLAQLEHLENFIEARKRNFEYLKNGLKSLEEFFILPEATPNSIPAWFGFPITIRDKAGFTRSEFMNYLDQKQIATRQIFAGNITKQPYFYNRAYRSVGSLGNTDTIMEHAFWIGVYPGLTEEMLAYVVSSFQNFPTQIKVRG